MLLQLANVASLYVNLGHLVPIISDLCKITVRTISSGVARQSLAAPKLHVQARGFPILV